MCDMTICACYAGLTNLRELNLEGCEDITSVAALSSMRKLRTLCLKRCSAVSGLQRLSGKQTPSCTQPTPVLVTHRRETCRAGAL